MTKEAVILLPVLAEYDRITSLNQKILFLSPEMPFWLLEQSIEISCHAIALVFQVPDKTDYRTYASQALVNLLNKLPSVEFADFIAWLYKYSRNSKVSTSP